MEAQTLEAMLNTLYCDAFECVVHSDSRLELLSVYESSMDARIRINVEVNTSGEFVSSWELEESTKPIDASSGEYKHVRITGVEPIHGQIRLDIEDVPVQAHPYPTSSVHNLEVFEKNTDELWAIGRDVSGQTWAFFRKTSQFGHYWIASKLNNSKSRSERISEKIRKGYREIGDNTKNHYDANDREVVVLH